MTSIPNHVHVCFYHESDYTDIICKRVDDDCVITKMSQYEDSKDWKIEGVSHVTVALNYLSRVLKSPKLKLEKLRLDFLEHNKEDTQCMEELLTVLENSEPHVLNIEFEGLNFHETSSVLKNLKNVEEIQLSMYSIQELSGIEKLVELEQWKTAKTLDISSHEDIEMDIKDLLHFQSIDVRLKSFSVQDAVKVKEVKYWKMFDPKLNFILIFRPSNSAPLTSDQERSESLTQILEKSEKYSTQNIQTLLTTHSTSRLKIPHLK